MYPTSYIHIYIQCEYHKWFFAPEMVLDPPGDVGSALAEALRWTALAGKLEEATFSCRKVGEFYGSW
jgi:hypothetical protein